MREIVTGRKHFFFFVLFFCLTVLTGCGQSDGDTVVLRVANAEEYIDEGGWTEEEEIELEDGTRIMGRNSMIEDFEEWYRETYGETVRVST